MLAVLGSIITSGLLVVILRTFSRYNLSLLQAITGNYIVCTICGLIATPEYFVHLANAEKDWVPLACLHGSLFMSLFFLIGRAAQRIGVAYTAMVTKVSVVIPTLLSVWVYKDPLDLLGMVGIGCALGAIIMLHLKYFQATDKQTDVKNQSMPPVRTIITYTTVLFIGTGIADGLSKVFEEHYRQEIETNYYIITLFGTAGIIGLTLSIISIIQNKTKFEPKNLMGATILGVPNYFSMVFFLAGLAAMHGPIFFPINNIGVLVFVALAGVILFKERFIWSSWVGLGLAVVSIFLIAHKEFGI